MHIFRIFFLFALVCISIVSCPETSAQIHSISRDADKIRFFNIETDTTKISDILNNVIKNDPGNPGERIAVIAQKFIDTPYVAHTLEVDSGKTEVLTVNICQLDCTTFVETVLALAKTASNGRGSWHDFIYNLENIRYRDGKMNGYASRLHYIADWIVNNSFRGNVKDVTQSFPKVNYATKSINFMTSNRDMYPSLSDSLEFNKIKRVEEGYKNHRYPYIKTIDLGNKSTQTTFKNGDIVALTSNLKNLDVTHMGIIIVKNNVPYLLHASSSLKKVVLTEVPLDKFMERNRNLTGVRVIRLLD